MDRREAIKSMVLGGATLWSAGVATSALAQQKRVVVGTWGGDYAALLRKNIEDPLLKPLGYAIVEDQAPDTARRSKLIAERRLPHGSTDVQALDGIFMYEMAANGVLENLDYSRIPNAAALMPGMKYPYGIGQIYSGKVIVYNPGLVAEPPASFKAAFDPKFGARLGFIDIEYPYVLTAASLAATNGASMTDYEKAKTLLLENKKTGVRIYPTNEAFGQALKSEEISLGIMWKARAVQWKDAGIPCATVAAAEGIPFYISGFVIPKNARNKEGAYAYLNAALDKRAQKAFALDMGYNPTVKGVGLPESVHARIGFTAAEEKQLKPFDYGTLSRNDAALKEWWDKVFKA